MKALASGFALSLILLLAAEVSSVQGSALLVFHTYTDIGCSQCMQEMQQHQRMSGHNFTVLHDLREGRNTVYYRRIMDLLAARDSRIGAEVPLTGLFLGEGLRAVVVGPMAAEAWGTIIEEAVSGAYGGAVPVYALRDARPIMVLREPFSIRLLSEMFTQASEPPELGRVSVPELLPIVVVAALADAVNVCELNAFLLMLTFVLFKVGEKESRSRVLRIGLSFSAAVFITYLAIGVGLIRVITGFSSLRWGIAALGLTVGGLSVIEFLGVRRKHVPEGLAERIRSRLERVLNPHTAFLAGGLVAALLLPCSSGPYFVVIGLLSEEATSVEGLMLLGLYNAIVVAPFLAITFSVRWFSSGTVGMRLWLFENQRWLRLFGGGVMILLSLLLIAA